MIQLQMRHVACRYDDDNGLTQCCVKVVAAHHIPGTHMIVFWLYQKVISPCIACRYTHCSGQPHPKWNLATIQVVGQPAGQVNLFCPSGFVLESLVRFEVVDMCYFVSASKVFHCCYFCCKHF
jgi:hypothetical protein